MLKFIIQGLAIAVVMTIGTKLLLSIGLFTSLIALWILAAVFCLAIAFVVHARQFHASSGLAGRFVAAKNAVVPSFKQTAMD